MDEEAPNEELSLAIEMTFEGQDYMAVAAPNEEDSSGPNHEMMFEGQDDKISAAITRQRNTEPNTNISRMLINSTLMNIPKSHNYRQSRLIGKEQVDIEMLTHLWREILRQNF